MAENTACQWGKSEVRFLIRWRNRRSFDDKALINRTLEAEHSLMIHSQKAMRCRRETLLVGGGLIDVVDDHDVGLGLGGLQLEPKLLL